MTAPRGRSHPMKNGTSDVDMPMNKEIKKRLQARKRQQVHRARLGNELTSLRHESIELENIIANLKEIRVSKGMTSLPWKEIAVALKEDTISIQEENYTLRQSEERFKFFLASLIQWLRPIERISNASASETWRDATLLASPESRALGLDWITQRLYQNTSRMLELHKFPPSSSFKEFSIEISDKTDSFEYSWRYQSVVKQPWTVVRDAFRTNLLQYRSCVLWFRDIDAKTHYEPLESNIVNYGCIKGTHDEAKFYYVNREFPNISKTGGCTFVGRHIHDDEAMPTCHQQRAHIYWLIVEPIDAFQCRLRYLYLKSQQFTKEGFVSIDEEAFSMGCDLTRLDSLEVKQKMFIRHATAAASRCSSKGTLHFDCTLDI